MNSFPGGFYRPSTPTWSVSGMKQPLDFYAALHPDDHSFYHMIMDRMRGREFGGGLGFNDAYKWHQRWVSGGDRTGMSPLEIGSAAAMHSIFTWLHHGHRFHQSLMDRHICRENVIAMAIAYARQFWHEIYGPMPDPRMEYACEIASATAYRTFDETELFGGNLGLGLSSGGMMGRPPMTQGMGMSGMPGGYPPGGMMGSSYGMNGSGMTPMSMGMGNNPLNSGMNGSPVGMPYSRSMNMGQGYYDQPHTREIVYVPQAYPVPVESYGYGYGNGMYPGGTSMGGMGMGSMGMGSMGSMGSMGGMGSMGMPMQQSTPYYPNNYPFYNNYGYRGGY